MTTAETDAALLRALAHPVRLQMMRQLAARPETCACDFTDVFAISQPTVSQHLKVLREAALVRTRRRGTQICYSVNPAGMQRVQDVITDITTLTALAPT
jgi:ArsR family transcriptional regulator, arsenate/arsenite/antimonite-responsive transcriptional repressor